MVHLADAGVLGRSWGRGAIILPFWWEGARSGRGRSQDPGPSLCPLDAATGKIAWSVPGGHPDAEAGDVQAVVAAGGKVYAGGHFAQMGGLVRKRLVEVDANTGQMGPWAPAIPGNETGNLGVWAVEVDPTRGRLYAGGDFLQVSGKDQNRFAQFSGL